MDTISERATGSCEIELARGSVTSRFFVADFANFPGIKSVTTSDSRRCTKMKQSWPLWSSMVPLLSPHPPPFYTKECRWRFVAGYCDETGESGIGKNSKPNDIRVTMLDDHRAFRRQLEDKRPVVESNLLSGRQYIANEPPLSDTSDTEAIEEVSLTDGLMSVCSVSDTCWL
ncbi:hypothetical protein J6590_020625 [Homalodisca vitripennis]|nr:hypothetical protein J6590_020625 [Homalodisca vitripennis]